MTVRRLAGGWVFLLAVMTVGQGQTAAAPVRVPITIGPETTHFVEPRLPDGTVDVFAALNARFAAGVTPDNNAAALLAGVLLEVPERSRAVLGIASEPKRPRFQRVRAFGGAEWKALLDQKSQGLKEPWRRADLPRLADWIDVNLPAALVVSAASNRPRHWAPFVPDINGEVWFPSYLAYREATEVFSARALRRLREGDAEGGWQDILTADRLAALLSQGPFLIERLVGAAMRGISTSSAVSFLPTARDAALARRRLDDLVARPVLPPLSDTLLEGERAIQIAACLEVARRVARKGPSAWAEALPLFIPSDRSDVPDLTGLSVDALDWDETLRAINVFFETGRRPSVEGDGEPLSEAIAGARRAGVAGIQPGPCGRE